MLGPATVQRKLRPYESEPSRDLTSLALDVALCGIRRWKSCDISLPTLCGVQEYVLDGAHGFRCYGWGEDLGVKALGYPKP